MKEYEGKYLSELSKKFKCRDECISEIIRLTKELDLPKGTEHFVSDLHGEFDAFLHLMNTASGVIENKIELLFGNRLNKKEISELAALIYYPREELLRIGEQDDEYYIEKAEALIEIATHARRKYTMDKTFDVIKGVSGAFSDLIFELLFDYRESESRKYRERIIKNAVRLSVINNIIEILAKLIKELLIDRLHVVGDIFDRGARADLIIDELIKRERIDITWGNHDVQWMGAASGSEASIAAVLNTSLIYGNVDILEIGYGISLRPLEELAEDVYKDSILEPYMPRGNGDGNKISRIDEEKLARMNKAIAVIRFKLEGELIRRNPSFRMEARRFLDKIDKKRGRIIIEGREYTLRDRDFPTINESTPYELSAYEREVICYFRSAFKGSERLSKHIRFLFEKGASYKIFNGNLIFHGTVPLLESGEFEPLEAAGGLSGKALLDFCDKSARLGFYGKEGTEKKRWGEDFLWFLAFGRDSPLSGRHVTRAFERLLIEEKDAQREEKNAYYMAWESEDVCNMILKEFKLYSESSRIINGHIPIKRGECPIKGGERLIVIDGGFCQAYHTRTGVGGYTLIYNSEGMKLCAHAPIKEGERKRGASHVISEDVVFKFNAGSKRVRECDEGIFIRERIIDIQALIKAYERGDITESREKQ